MPSPGGAAGDGEAAGVRRSDVEGAPGEAAPAGAGDRAVPAGEPRSREATQGATAGQFRNAFTIVLQFNFPAL